MLVVEGVGDSKSGAEYLVFVRGEFVELNHI